MAYLSKKTLLEAYKVLSTLSEQPSAQGATQKVSAIRYALALDMFYKKNNRECDTRDGKDKNEFSNNVYFIVALSDILYTANFYTSVPVHQGDCAVGSNFYSVNAVKNSLTNPTITINYPQRGNSPLFNIQGGKLYQIESYKKNIDFYVSGNNHKFALILWILRNELLDFSNLYASIKMQLQRFFTPTMLNYLLPSEDDFSEFRKQTNIESQQDKSVISSNDILALFKETNLIKKTQTTSAGLFKMSTYDKYLPYLTALRTKPFLLLAGISGTGKSRIVREMAKACWASDEEDYGNNCPRNFCMVQVKPNWHDSSELIGYVSRINGEKYIIGPFLRFIAQALKEPQRPYFLCLDEMNLAPVEQYFAEFLSVIESRQLQDGQIVTDPIVPYENTEAYGSLIDQLFASDEERKAYKTEKIEEGGKRLTIPQNLFVVGTVNMDETTFSFSRKVLDRAMTIEMNEVKLDAGLNANSGNELGYIGSELMGQAVEGRDIYADHQPMCNEVISYLQKVNEVLDATPFKIAYRTRNEFLLYAVNRKTFAPKSELWQTLDEMTSMKILSRIEGDTERCEKPLRGLEALLRETLGDHAAESVSLRKIEEMTRKLQSGYTSYWT